MITALEIFKPCAKPGQVILCVNLSKTGDFSEAMKCLNEMGYTPELRHISLREGIQVFAILKDEQHEKGVTRDYLMNEWERLVEKFSQSHVHLWRGYSTLEEARAA